MLCMVHALLAMKDPGKIRSIVSSLLTFIAVTVIKKSMESILPNGVTLSLFSSILGMWLATSAGHRLIQGWVHTTSTKVASSSALLGVASDRPKIRTTYQF